MKYLLLFTILLVGCAKPSVGPKDATSSPVAASIQAATPCPISSVSTSSAHFADPGWHWWKCTGAAPMVQFALFSDGTAAYFDGAAWAPLTAVQYGAPSCTTIFYRQDNGNEALGIWNVVGNSTTISAQLNGQSPGSYSCVWN